MPFVGGPLADGILVVRINEQSGWAQPFPRTGCAPSRGKSIAKNQTQRLKADSAHFGNSILTGQRSRLENFEISDLKIPLLVVGKHAVAGYFTGRSLNASQGA